MRKLGLFFKAILKKTKATEKQLKRTKSKKGKQSKLVMLNSFAYCFFMSLNVKKISTGLNKNRLCFFCFCFFNVHFNVKNSYFFVPASSVRLLLLVKLCLNTIALLSHISPEFTRKRKNNLRNVPSRLSCPL